MAMIVGVVGFVGSGKDTVGNFIVDNYHFKRDSFAAPLKDAVAAVFGWPRHMLEGDTKESRAWRDQPDTWWEECLDWHNHPGSRISSRFTPRVAMQWWGTEVLRTGFHDGLWILSLQNRLRTADRVVVTDCRFPNEISTIKSLNGRVIRVKRGPEPDWYDTAIAANTGEARESFAALSQLKRLGIHASEYSWIGSDFDFVIENESTLEDLEEKVRCTLNTSFSL